MLDIRPAMAEDFEAIYQIFQAVVEPGDTYAFPPNMTREAVQAIWTHPDYYPYVAVEGEEIVGTYTFHPNQPKRGAHVANASYMVKPGTQGKGIGRKMGEHSLVESKQKGFQAMQFNIVVSTNQPAVRLWQSLGFTIIGTVPKAFQHANGTFVDTYIMHRFL